MNKWSQAASPLKFVNGNVISSHNLWRVLLLTHVEKKLIHVSKEVPENERGEMI